jgi:hypothetical protein
MGKRYLRQITDAKSSNDMKYLVIIGGWDNTGSKVIRSDEEYLGCDFYHSIDLDRWNDYKLTMIADIQTVKLEINGQEVWSCWDMNGYYAPNASYVGISRWKGYSSVVCNVQTLTYVYNPLY